MVKVQLELAEFKTKSSEYYLNMKKSEKIRMLENSLTFFREECVKLASSIDVLKRRTKKLTGQLKFANAEIDSWHDEAKTLKYQNILLRNAVN